MQSFLIILLLSILINCAHIENHKHKKDFQEIVKSIHNSQNEINKFMNEPMDARNHFNSADHSRRLSKNEVAELYVKAVREIEKRRDEKWNNVIEQDLRDSEDMDFQEDPGVLSQPSFFDTIMDSKGKLEKCTCSTINEKEEYLIIAFKDQSKYLREHAYMMSQ